jgi:hypothetical protein
MAFEPKLVVLASACPAGRAVRRDLPEHSCERCRCCACHKLCTRCRANCRPMETSFIPVVYCPDYVDTRSLRPVRYFYRSGYDCEYRLRLPGTR